MRNLFTGVPGFKVLTAVDGVALEYVEMTCYLEKSVTRQSTLAGLRCRVRVRGQTGPRGNGIYDLSKTFRPELGEDEMITEAIATTCDVILWPGTL